jgi:hypothetical protein
MDDIANPNLDHQRNVALDLVLTILLCGLWNAVVQMSHCKTLNYLLKEEKYSFWKMYLFSILTCGIYFIYYEYQKANDFMKLTKSNDSSDPVLAVVLSLFGLNFVYDAILQTKINDYLNRRNEFAP